MGEAREEMRDLAGALTAYERAAAIWKGLAAEFPGERECGSDLASCQERLGDLKSKLMDAPAPKRRGRLGRLR